MRSVQGLDLRLLVDAKHGGFLGRVQVETHDITHLLGELRILADLERPRAMRIEAVELPDAMDGRMAHANGFGHRPSRPVRRASRLLVKRLLQDLIHDLFRDLGLASRTRRILLDTGETVRLEPRAPQADRVRMRVELSGDLLVLQAFGSFEDDTTAQHEALRS